MSLARVAAVAALVLAVGCSKKQSGNEILIGHVASLTGSEATFGSSTDNGIKLALAEANKKGGVKGKQLALKTLDNQGKPEESTTAAKSLIVTDKVTVLLGEVASSRSLAMAPIADSYKVPMITPSSTNPRVTKDGEKTRPFVFRVCFIDPFQGTVMATFAHDNLKLTKVAILRDVGSDYSVGLANFFAQKFKELGGEVVSDQSYKAGDPDFKAQLTQIRQAQPEAVFVPGYYTDVGLIARQARELGMKQPLLGGDGWDSSKLYEIASGALDGSYFSNHYSHDNPDPVIQEFVTKYKETYGEVPDGLAATGYDAARVAIDAMNRANELTGPAIAQAIADTKSFKGVSGTITIDQNHNAVKSAVVLGIEGNGPKFKATINP